MKHKGAALADDDLLGQGFRYDELAPKTSSGDGSQPSNGGMHLRGPVGWLDTRKKLKLTMTGNSLSNTVNPLNGDSDRMARVPQNRHMARLTNKPQRLLP